MTHAPKTEKNEGEKQGQQAGRQGSRKKSKRCDEMAAGKISGVTKEASK
jgi:hypothetical protein